MSLMLTSHQEALAIVCGGFVGLALALTGGGGSILAVPLLIYVVGLDDPHLAIGTSALAVSVNAYANLVPHARDGNVRWGAGVVFALAGAAGALAGSSVGKQIDGQQLLSLFAVLMLVVAALMLRGRKRTGPPHAHDERFALRELVGVGVGAGGLSGFFGIGGGFLVVPGLMLATRMKILNAVATSLVAVGTFGLATALNYSRAGWVDGPLAALFIGGGVIGGWIGARLAKRLAATQGALNTVFATMIAAVAVYTLLQGKPGMTAPASAHARLEAAPPAQGRLAPSRPADPLAQPADAAAQAPAAARPS